MLQGLSRMLEGGEKRDVHGELGVGMDFRCVFWSRNCEIWRWATGDVQTLAAKEKKKDEDEEKGFQEITSRGRLDE